MNQESKKLNILIGLWNSPTMMGGYYSKALKDKANIWTAGPKVSDNNNDYTLEIGDPIIPIIEKIPEKIDFYLSFYSKPDFLPCDLHELPIPSAWYIYDTHLHLDELSTTAYLFDHVFCPDHHTMLQLEELGVGQVSVLPFAADKSFYYRPFREDIERIYDLGFCGSISDHPELAGRKALVERLQKKFNVKVENRSLFGTEVADFYQQCKVVLNHAVKDDYNMRVPEVLLCGRPLLTPKVTGIENYLVDGVHAQCYTKENVEEKLQELLDHPNKAEAMAKAGQEEYLQKHTYDHRADLILETLTQCLGSYKNTGRPKKNPWLKKAAQFRYHYFRHPGDAALFVSKDRQLNPAIRFADRILKLLLKLYSFILKFSDRVRGSRHFQSRLDD